MLNPINCLNKSFTRSIKAADILQETLRQIIRCVLRRPRTVHWWWWHTHTGLFRSKFHSAVSWGLSNYAAYWVFISPHGQVHGFQCFNEGLAVRCYTETETLSRSPQVTPSLHPLLHDPKSKTKNIFCLTMSAV